MLYVMHKMYMYEAYLKCKINDFKFYGICRNRVKTIIVCLDEDWP